MKKKILFLTANFLACWAISLTGCISRTASVCPDCKGQAKHSLCSTCWGEGLRLEQEKVTYQRCPTCLGTGQNPTMHRPVVDESLARFTSFCPSCSGRGQRKVVTPVRVHCSRCDGTGKGRTQVVCARCSGTGQWKGIFRAGKNRRGWVPPPAIVAPDSR